MQKAFSLVELSIVLVIIALIVGGITAGQSILRNAKLKTITTDFAVYQSAMANFNDRYSELPGDFSHATDVWGEANAIPATCADTASTDKKTCNGDGDGAIEPSSAGSDEIFRFWQHLANAGMIEGVFTGISTDNADHDRASLGVNVPRSSVDNAGWSIGLVGNTAASFPTTAVYHGLLFGAVETNGDTREIVLAPEDAGSIDDKIDDGFPGRGEVLTWNNTTHSNCATTDVTTTAVYNLTYDDEACALIFKTGF